MLLRLLLVLGLLLLLLLLVLGLRWLLHGGCRASFPLLDQMRHRLVSRPGVAVGWLLLRGGGLICSWAGGSSP